MKHAAWWSSLILLTCALGEARAQELSAAEQRLLERLVLAEARGEGELGMALVARATLNRAALVQAQRVTPGTYNASGRTLRDVVMARGQYQPVTDGSLYARRTAAQHAEARQAIALARDTQALRQRLRQAGESPAAIERLLNATGFRAGTAFRDSSQNYQRERFGDHVFNGDRFSVRENVQSLFERRFGRRRGQTTTAAAARPSGGASSATGKAGPRAGMRDVVGRIGQ